MTARHYAHLAAFIAITTAVVVAVAVAMCSGWLTELLKRIFNQTA